jgi:hypothetical protein
MITYMTIFLIINDYITTSSGIGLITLDVTFTTIDMMFRTTSMWMNSNNFEL